MSLREFIETYPNAFMDIFDLMLEKDEIREEFEDQIISRFRNTGGAIWSQMFSAYKKGYIENL